MDGPPFIFHAAPPRRRRRACQLGWLILATAALAREPPSFVPAPAADGGAALASAGHQVGEYLLLEKVQSVPSTFAPSADPMELDASHTMELAEPSTAIQRWSQLLLPDADLLTFPSDNATSAARARRTWPALPSPEAPPRTPRLPQSFEGELASSRSAYRLHRRFQRGAHGEVWRAVRRDDPSGTPLIVKRLHQGTVEGHPSAALLAGLRERHFGETLRGVPRIARFVECFEAEGSFWLVFRDEGVSLKDLFYSWRANAPKEVGAEAGAEHIVAVQPSALWLRLRLHPSGRRVLRHMLRQFFEGIERLHARNVTHRDLKPANTIIDLRGVLDGGAPSDGGGGGTPPEAGRDAARDRLPSLRLADFGSALDAQTVQPGVGLYPGNGPSSAEETAEYQPPEASIGDFPFDRDDPRTYDLWSAGIVTLELLLATPHVLALSGRAAATLELRHSGQSPQVQRRLRIANGLAEHCISPAQGGRVPSAAAPLQLRRLAHSCGRAEFIAAVRKSDPLPELLESRGRKAPEAAALDEELLDLAWRLLRWHPAERMGAAAALRHPALGDAASAGGTEMRISYFRGMDAEELRQLTRPMCGGKGGGAAVALTSAASGEAEDDEECEAGTGRPPRVPAEQERGISRWLFDWASWYKQSGVYATSGGEVGVDASGARG